MTTEVGLEKVRGDLKDELGEVKGDIKGIRGTLDHVTTRAELEKSKNAVIIWTVGTIIAAAAALAGLIAALLFTRPPAPLPISVLPAPPSYYSAPPPVLEETPLSPPSWTPVLTYRDRAFGDSLSPSC